jgi:hypothetical protein
VRASGTGERVSQRAGTLPADEVQAARRRTKTGLDLIFDL